MPKRADYSREYYLKNKERIKERNALRYQSKREHILAQSNSYYHQNKEKRQDWKEKNKEKLAVYFQNHYRQNSDVKKRRNRVKRFKEYQITEDQYNRMFDLQEGRCKGCNTHQDDLSKRLCVDHCHETGKIRGLLCTNCNLAIGLVADSPEVLLSLIDYLLVNETI